MNAQPLPLPLEIDIISPVLKKSSSLPPNNRNLLPKRPQSASPNFKNRTFWVDDNLRILKGINSGCVDLIYLDPPYNSKRLYSAPLGSKSAGAKFRDTWTMDNVKDEWLELQKRDNPDLYHVATTAGLTADDSMRAYLTFMALRLLEVHRVLKPTGAVWLHCDHHAAHYLKQLMDCIFTKANFRNEIIWQYGAVSMTNASKCFPSKHDTLFFYSKTDNYYFENPRENEISQNMKKVWGRYAQPDQKSVFYGSIKHHKYAGERYKKQLRKKLGRDPKDNDIAFTLKPSLLKSVWHIPEVRNRSSNKESTGWPTQKPLTLLERIVEATCPKDGILLDPFAGCATACVAAERLGRRWAGIDIDKTAITITRTRLQEEADTDSPLFKGELPTIHLPQTPPKRTDLSPSDMFLSTNIRAHLWGELTKHRTDIDRAECPGCERYKYFDDMELDHIIPKVKGGSDNHSNLQLLCCACNRMKGSTMTMKELKQKRIADSSYLDLSY